MFPNVVGNLTKEQKDALDVTEQQQASFGLNLHQHAKHTPAGQLPVLKILKIVD